LTAGGRALVGRRVLIVEDDFNIARALERLLKMEGAEISGPAPTVHAAMALIESGERIDGALLDVNLRQHTVYEVADALLTRGVRVVFTSGYDTSFIEPRFAHVPCVQKPCPRDELVQTLLGSTNRSALPPPVAD
jgi:CheY-like chemotaxis protein